MAGNDWMPQGATEVTATPTPDASKGAWMPQGATEVQPKPSAMDYWVKNPAISAGKALVGDAKDIGNAVIHPADTIGSLAKSLFDHPVDNLVNTVKGLPKSVPDMVMNHPLQTAAMVLPGAEGAAGLAGKGIDAAKSTMSDIGAKNLDNRIFGLYNGAVGAKAKNLGDVTKVQPQRLTALKTMSDNLPNVTLESGEDVPKNRYDLAQTLRQTKQAIWQKVSDLSGGATDAGAKIPMAPIVQRAVNDTIKGIGQDALTANPNLLKSIQREAMNVSRIGVTTPARAQVYMASLNKQLKSMFNSGQAVDYSVLDFKRNLINHLNDATESTIEDTLNKSGYGALRDQYAALKSTEKEIVSSTNKYLSQQGGQGGGIAHPIVNLWSIEQGMEAAGHLATGNIPGAAGSLVRAASVKIASKLADFMKNPDNKIPKMFDLLKKYKGSTSDMGGGVDVNESVSPHRTPPTPVDAELIDTRPKGIGQNKPVLRNDRLLPGKFNSGRSSVNTGTETPPVAPEYKTKTGLPFYSADESGRIKGTGFLMGEKKLTPQEANDHLIMAEKPIGDMTHEEQIAHQDKVSSIKMDAEMAKNELKMLQSWRKDLSGKINMKEFNKGESQDLGKHVKWAISKSGGSALDDKASEFFSEHPEAYPKGFKGHDSDALLEVIKDLSQNRDMRYQGYLRNAIASARKIKP